MSPASRISIKVSLPLSISLLVLLTFGTIALIVNERVGKSTTALAVQNLAQIHERIGQRLDDFFSIPERLTRINERLISQGMFNRSDIRAWQPVLYEQIRAFSTVSSILWGNAAGSAVFMIRLPQLPDYIYGIADTATDHQAEQFRVDADGRVSPDLWTEVPYDPRTRPWYRAAVDAGRLTWTDVYSWPTGTGRPPVLSIACAAPVTVNGVLTGVTGVESSLFDIGQFLRTLSIGRTGVAYIMDRKGRLVASSIDVPVMGTGSDARIAAADTANGLISGSARQLALMHAGADDMMNFHDMFNINHGRVFLMASPFEKPGHLKWQVVTVVPEDDFLGDIKTARLQTIQIVVVAVLSAVLLGILLARHLSGPIVELAEHVRLIGRGELDREIRLHGAPEFVRLSGAINRMTEGLRERMQLRESLAMAGEVQQRLLPVDTPKLAGLEIAGHSKYCDQTGGDYYDYLEIRDAGDDSAVVAIGDVSGHGIAAAMVMASARGILRSRSREAGSLAELLSHMNRQITEDSAAGRFMTMLLVMVSGSGTRLRWASAGHRPPLIFDPEDRRIHEPDGADVPLGVVCEAGFSEYEFTGLRAGQVILLSTDGLWEAPNAAGEAFGLERMRNVLRESAGLDAEAIRERLVGAVEDFCAGAPQQDDITFVVVRVTGARPAQGAAA